MPYALCPMPTEAVGQIVPHVTEKGYIATPYSTIASLSLNSITKQDSAAEAELTP